MICPKCQSTNVHIQIAKSNNPIIIGAILSGGGVGLMWFGVIGAVGGVIIGWVLGAISKAIMPTPRESIAVCQKCGYFFNPSEGSMIHSTIPLNITSKKNSDMQDVYISRISNSCGSAVDLNVRIDNMNTVSLGNGQQVIFSVVPGNHTLFYEQIRGAQKKKRTGSLFVCVEIDKPKQISIMFTHKGLAITEV